MILINGKADDRINVADRGLQYGDGLFETIAYRNGLAEFIDAHLDRMIAGCQRLAIPFQQLEVLRSELNTVCQQLDDNDAVIKIIVTRGSGGRGYLANNDIEPTRIISTHPLPQHPESNKTAGICVRFCQHNLSENSALAGIKHLNRLDQVLARNEWHQSNIAEGLMSDTHGNMIEGTMSNIFIVKSGQIKTPELTKSGVAGIMRAQIIRLASENGLTVEQGLISKKNILEADEVFVCNSIIGIWPVNSIDGTNTVFQIGNVTQGLQHALAESSK